MKRGRRILAAVLVMCMVMGLVLCPVKMEKVQAEVFGDYEYEVLENGTVEIIKYSGEDEYLIIPEKINERIVSSIGKRAFSGCLVLSEIEMSDNIINIGDYAFSECEELTRIELSKSITSIGKGAFNECTLLEEIDIPDGVNTIRDFTFLYCESLERIYIPDSVTSIGVEAFDECRSLKEINIPNSVTSIGMSAFQWCTDLEEISIPNGVESIGDSTFNYCTSLTKINIPSSVLSIESTAFNSCRSLANIYYSGTKSQWDKIEIDPEYNQYLQNASIHFSDDETINENDFAYIILNDGTVEIIQYRGSDKIVKIPSEIDGKRVVSIGEHIFENFEEFDNEGLTEVIIPASVTNINKHTFEKLWLDRITVETNNAYYSSDEGVLFNKDKTQIIRCPTNREGSYNIPSSVKEVYDDAFSMCMSLTEIIIPDSVISIGEYAFSLCTSLKEIVIPNTITNIEKGAFYNCMEVKKIVIPDGVVSIGADAFNACQFMEEVVVPDSVTSIGNWAFANCQCLKEIVIPDGVISIGDGAFTNTGLIKIVIPNNMTSIGIGFFSLCEDLEEIVIPDSITSIDNHAFEECISLKNVYYTGTKEQWNQIKVGSTANEALLNATIHFKNEQPTPPAIEEIIQPTTSDARQELERLKSGDSFALVQDFQYYLSNEQIDIMESYLYTWLTEINYAHWYSDIVGVKECIMKKSGIDPQGDFTSGKEQAVTHICVETKYGAKTFEITLDIGKLDSSGNLYPSYGAMHYEMLEKESIPSDLPTSGQIGRESYADLGTFAECVRKASEDSLHGIYQWESLDEEMTAGVLVDKTVTEIIGNKNGSFSDAVFTIYAKPLLTYSKKVTIACPVDVHVYSMDGKEAGSIVGNKPEGGNANVRLDVNGDTKTVYLAGNDYYLNLRGTDTGTMRYEVEEIANEEVRRNVQFLELQLEKDMQYEGYVFRPLNIDRDLYALRTVGGSEQKVFHADKDTYQALFRRIQSLSLSQGQTSLDRDKTVQLQASLYPLDASNPNLQWITDNESIIKVDNNGLVTAVGAGRATVTAATKDGSFLKQYCVIDVAEGNHGSGGSGSSSGSSGGSGSGSSSGSSGWYGGSTPAPVEQEKTPVVVNLHYVLQFHANGGTGLSRRTMTLLADDSPGIMPKVKRKDFIFDGWYTQQDGGEQVTGDKPLKEAATLYARWTKAEAPAKAAAPTLQSKKKGQMQVSLNNVTGAAGYQIEYSISKKFTSAKVKDVGAAAKKTTIFGLKAGQKYYVRLRAYSLDSMRNRIYGEYSAAKSVSVKK